MLETYETNPRWREKLSEMDVPLSVRNDGLLTDVLKKTIDGTRISTDIGIKLHSSPNLTGIAALADSIKRSRFGDFVFFNANLHVNTTNVCTLACRFCAFRRGSRSEDAYSLSPEDFVSRIAPYSSQIDEVHACLLYTSPSPRDS